MKRTVQEIKADIENVENVIIEMEQSFIKEHEINSRDGYIPLCLDEIGNEELRNWAKEKFNADNMEILFNYEALKAELLEVGGQNERN